MQFSHQFDELSGKLKNLLCELDIFYGKKIRSETFSKDFQTLSKSSSTRFGIGSTICKSNSNSVFLPILHNDHVLPDPERKLNFFLLYAVSIKN